MGVKADIGKCIRYPPGLGVVDCFGVKIVDYGNQRRVEDSLRYLYPDYCHRRLYRCDIKQYMVKN